MERKFQIKKTIVIELTPKQALFIKAVFQNCPPEKEEDKDFYREIFELFPSYDEIGE